MVSFTPLNIKSFISHFVTVLKHFCCVFLLLSLFLRFGRHPVLILSVLFMLVFGLSVAFSVNVTMFSTLRFFEGFCLAGLALSLYVLSKYLLSTPPPCLLFYFCFPAPLFPHSSSLLYCIYLICDAGVVWIPGRDEEEKILGENNYFCIFFQNLSEIFCQCRTAIIAANWSKIQRE